MSTPDRHRIEIRTVWEFDVDPVGYPSECNPSDRLNIDIASALDDPAPFWEEGNSVVTGSILVLDGRDVPPEERITASLPGWEVVIADDYGFAIGLGDANQAFDPDSVSGEGPDSLSVRRGSALPDEHDALPGSYLNEDVLYEIDLSGVDDIEFLTRAYDRAKAVADAMNEKGIQ